MVPEVYGTGEVSMNTSAKIDFRLARNEVGELVSAVQVLTPPRRYGVSDEDASYEAVRCATLSIRDASIVARLV